MALLIHHSISYTPIDTSFSDAHAELQAVKLQINNSDIVLFNLYVPPASSCAAGYQLNVDSILTHSDDDTVILGDVNAHHDAWHSPLLADARGRRLASAIADNPFIILNENEVT